MRINDALGVLVSVYQDWGHVLANPRYVRSDRTITWINNSSPRLADPVTPDDISALADDGQYSFQIAEDGSLLQLYYEYEDADDHRIKSASLAYYGAPIAYGTEPPFIRWCRLDYDPSSSRGVIHSDSHIHLSYFPDSRLMVKGLPTPKQFIEFIMALCYPNLYEEHRLDARGQYKDKARNLRVNEPSIQIDEGDLFNHITYLCIPSAP